MEYVAFVAAYADTKLPDILAVPTDPFFVYGSVSFPIYVYVDDGVRLKRALNREMQQKEPKYAELCRRFLADEADFSKENIEKNNINKMFENNDLEECIDEIKDYILSYR
jgi:guanylate kinase